MKVNLADMNTVNTVQRDRPFSPALSLCTQKTGIKERE
jgi:hypothetical protein